MSIDLNHTIVAARDKHAESRFVAEVLGLTETGTFRPFAVAALSYCVGIGLMETDEVPAQHSAFLISQQEFDAVAGRLRERGVATYGDPMHQQPGHNTHDGRRGLVFSSPEGHNLEVITRPYGSGGS